MPNSFKNTWWVFLLVGAGAIIFLLSLYSNKPQRDQGVVLNDIFHQQPAKATSPNGSSVPTLKADPIPSVAIVTSPVNGHETDIAIQVYSFQDKKRAETALEALKNSKYQAFLIMSDLGDKGVWYRVRVGGIKDEVQAHKMLEEIRKNYNSGFIVGKSSKS